MSEKEILEKQTDDNGEMKIESYDIDYEKLHGRGGAFLITPLGSGSIFSREQFTEEHKMFEQTAKEFGENRILAVRDELNVLNKDINIGVAISVEDGLVVPVIRNTDQNNILEISEKIKNFVQKANDKKLSFEELSGNTFTVSNLGMFGIDEFTAIINPPDACILAIGTINKKPIVKNEELAIGHVMKITLSSDHRIVDGAEGAKFLRTLKMMLENPLLMI